MIITKRSLIKYSLRFIFCIIFFCATSLLFDTWNEFFLFHYSEKGFYVKLLFAVFGVLFSSYAVCVNEKSCEFIKFSSGAFTIVFFVLFFVDMKTFNLANSMPGFSSSLHFTYSFAAFCSLYAGAWAATQRVRCYSSFYSFFKVYTYYFTAVFLLVTVLMAFVYRTHGDQTGVNLIPFKGEIKVSLYYLSSGQPLLAKRSLSNILFFVPVAPILYNLIEKDKSAAYIIVPVCLSATIEILQRVLACGECDIDDVILNTIGSLIGLLLCNIFLKKTLREGKKCSV